MSGVNGNRIQQNQKLTRVRIQIQQFSDNKKAALFVRAALKFLVKKLFKFNRVTETDDLSETVAGRGAVEIGVA
jgi:hypothetical protein